MPGSPPCGRLFDRQRASMPPSRWPGTVQKKVYWPGFRSIVVASCLRRPLRCRRFCRWSLRERRRGRRLRVENWRVASPALAVTVWRRRGRCPRLRSESGLRRPPSPAPSAAPSLGRRRFVVPSSSPAAGDEGEGRECEGEERGDLLHPRSFPWGTRWNVVIGCYTRIRAPPGAQRPSKSGSSPPKKAVTPLRRSSVAMLSAIPWRSSWRCSARLFSMLSPRGLGHLHVVGRLGGQLLGLRASAASSARRARRPPTRPFGERALGVHVGVVEEDLQCPARPDHAGQEVGHAAVGRGADPAVGAGEERASEAILVSQASASEKPAPAAGPLTAATTG